MNEETFWVSLVLKEVDAPFLARRVKKKSLDLKGRSLIPSVPCDLCSLVRSLPHRLKTSWQPQTTSEWKQKRMSALSLALKNLHIWKTGLIWLKLRWTGPFNKETSGIISLSVAFNSKGNMRSADIQPLLIPPSLTLRAWERGRENSEITRKLSYSVWQSFLPKKWLYKLPVVHSYVSSHWIISHFLERWEISSHSPPWHLFPQPQTLGISGWIATVMGKACNCQNRKTPKAQTQERHWRWPNRMYHGYEWCWREKSLQVLCGCPNV